MGEKMSENKEETSTPKVEETPTPKVLNFQDIRRVDDLKEEYAEVPEWGGQVLIREMTAGDRDWFEGSLVAEAATAILTTEDAKGNKLSMDRFRVKLVAACVVDPGTKRRIFDTPDKVEVLAQKSGSVVSTLAEVAQRLNKMTEKDIQEMADELGKALAASSSSDSQENSATEV